jgi:hypothetical protein
MALDQYALVSLHDLRLYLGITTTTDETLLERCIERATGVCEAYCGRKFKSRDYVEWRDTGGQSRVSLKETPVTFVKFVGVAWDETITVGGSNPADAALSVSVTEDAVKLYRMTSAGTETTTTLSFATYPTTSTMTTAIAATTGFTASLVKNVPTRRLRRTVGADLINETQSLDAPVDALYEYQVDDQTGILYGPTLRAYRALLVEYTAGYTTMPFDVTQACLMVASRLYKGRTRDEGIQSESLGGYSYTLRGTAELDADAKALLDPYKRVR